MDPTHNYSKEAIRQPVYPAKAEPSSLKSVKEKSRGLAKDIQKLASNIFAEIPLMKRFKHLSKGHKIEVLPSQKDDLTTIEAIAIAKKLQSTANAINQLNASDWKEMMQDLFTSDTIVLEIHGKEAKNIKYHAIHTPKGQQVLAKKGLILHKKHGIIGVNKKAQNKLMKQKIQLHDDPTATPEIRQQIASLKEKPLVVSLISSEMMEEFHESLMQQIMTMQVMHSKPHAKTNSEDIQKLERSSVYQSSAKEKSEKSDPFTKAKEILIQIFLSSYQSKVAIEKERAQKAREQEKENKKDLEKKERMREIEEKEHKEKEIDLEVLAKNQSQHARLDKNAAEVDAKTRSRKYRP